MGLIEVNSVNKGSLKGLEVKRKPTLIIINVEDSTVQFADINYKQYLETPTGDEADVVRKSYRVVEVSEQLLAAAQAMVNAACNTLENDDRLPVDCASGVVFKKKS